MVVILFLSPSTTNGCDQSLSTDSTASTSSTATTAIPAISYYANRQTEFRPSSISAITNNGLQSIKRKLLTSYGNYDRRQRLPDNNSINDKINNCNHRVRFQCDQRIPSIPNAIPKPPRQKNRKKDFVRHVTRVNFCDYDSQVDVGADGNAEATTKEEEWITKRKTELTTTRQIETRVKRQVVLEDGKVVEDSGPMVSTNTTEDTDKKETESTERRNLGDPDVVDGPEPIEYNLKRDDNILDRNGKELTKKLLPKLAKNKDNGKVLVARPDGLVREVKEKRVVSREEVKECLETEDVRHLGDFSDEAYVKAVNSGVENLEEVLYSPEHQRQLVSLGPKIVHQSTKLHKTVDTEDTDQKCLAQSDGTLVTEKKKTTEHEELFDEDLPENDDNSTGSKEKINHKESSQRYYKQRDEQNVEYVADGKVIGKEMKYAAETEQMERDGPPEGPNDWDSLSDRIRKVRRTQKTLLQQQKEAALLADRKDALTKRPLDFDREEETRKGETMKWLESHFGSESTTSSHDSRDGDHDDIEPTKKTYFNVTIKSNQTAVPRSTSPIATSTIRQTPNGKGINGHLNSPSPKVIVQDDLDPITSKTKYFQGITNWSERKESTPKHFASKAFRDELKGTLERNRLRQAASREDVRYVAKSHKDEYVRKEDILLQKNAKHYNNYGSRTDLRQRKDSREDSDDSKTIRAQKEDLGYLSGSRTDLQYRRDSNGENDRTLKHRKANGYLKREDSGYVKDSREDVRSSLLRDIEDEREKYKNSLIQRDDSAYVSSSTYFTDTRSPKTPQMRTPDSGIRSPSPEIYDPEVGRPNVPQRKRAIEKKLRQQNSYSPPLPPTPHLPVHDEPPPDYTPPPRSRSISPVQMISTTTQNGHISTIPNGINRKQNQRTRFASESSSTSHNNNTNSNHHHRQAVATQTIQTQTSPPPKQSTKVGQAIGNSIRKLVGKIRSASAERKFKMKSKSRNRSPSPSSNNKQMNTPGNNNGSTYQQYNVIDSHIGGQIQPIVSGSQQQQSSIINNRESSVVSSSTTAGRRERDRDLEMTSPKQRYYLGEDPYGGSIFGKENKYDGVRPSYLQNHRSRRSSGGIIGNSGLPNGNNGSGDDRELYVQRNVSASTLGRFSKSTNRLGSTPNLDQDYRSNAQTLPRKLDHRPPNHHSSTINVSIVNQVKQPPPPPQLVGQPTQNTGPAKPARTYKSLSRSKSFNVHGMNGTNDPSPIYMEKLTRNNYSNNNMYKSNPHLHESGPQLKSPSIVNLISRSQKDLTRIDEDRKYPNYLNERRYISNNNTNNNSNYHDHNNINNNHQQNHHHQLNGGYDKRNLFLKGLQEQSPELYKTLHGDEEPTPIRNGYSSGGGVHHKYPAALIRERESSSLGSRSPIEINKDTASIIRRGSSSTEDYSETYKITKKSDDPRRPSVTNTVQSFTKKTIPSKDGRGFETIQSSERKSVTTSRYRGEPMSNLKYVEEQKRRGSSSGGGPVVIEVRNSRK